MLAQSPLDLKKVNKKDLDKEILRLGMIAELDAVNLLGMAKKTQGSLALEMN